MIYTRWGLEFDIVGKKRAVNTEFFDVPITLVRSSDGRYQFAEFLKADNGITEIVEAITAAEELELTEEQLQAAIKEAS